MCSRKCRFSWTEYIRWVNNLILTSPLLIVAKQKSSSSQGSLILVPSDLIWRPKQSVEWEARQKACTCQIYFARTDCFCTVLQYHMKIGFCKDVENVCSIFHPCRKTRKASTIPLICVDQFCHCHMEPNWYQGFYKFGKKNSSILSNVLCGENSSQRLAHCCAIFLGNLGIEIWLT